MLNKDQLLESCLKECRICLHLFEKIPVGGLTYRPTPKQRNLLELLRYLTISCSAGAHAVIDGNWEWYKQAVPKTEQLSPEQFPSAMRQQMQDLEALFAGISNEAFSHREATLPNGQIMPLGLALMEMALKRIVGYRMQLFLYVKAAGNSAIGTSNCWHGTDPAPKQP